MEGLPNIQPTDLEEYHRIPFNHLLRYCQFEAAERLLCGSAGMDFPHLDHTPNGYQYTNGYRQVRGIDFVCLNTEWDFWGSKLGGAIDQSNSPLRIGLTNYEQAMTTLVSPSYALGQPPRFVVYHRPLEHLHRYEQIQKNPKYNDKCVGNRIVLETDVSLTGHDHDQRGIYAYNGKHTRIAAGTIYAKKYYSFSCNLLSVPKNPVAGFNPCMIRQFRYSTEFSKWLLKPPTTFHIFRESQKNALQTAMRSIDLSKPLNKSQQGIQEALRNLQPSDRNILLTYVNPTLPPEYAQTELFKHTVNELQGKKVTEPMIDPIGKDISSFPTALDSINGLNLEMERIDSFSVSPNDGYIPSDINKK